MADFDGTCEIRRAGVTGDGRALLDLKGNSPPTFDWSWVNSTPESTREVMAVALTAVASNKLVYCTITPLPAPGTTPVVANFALVK